jgi:hypothetical protein
MPHLYEIDSLRAKFLDNFNDFVDFTWNWRVFEEIEERSRREELRGPRVDRRCFNRYKKNSPLPKLIRIPPKLILFNNHTDHHLLTSWENHHRLKLRLIHIFILYIYFDLSQGWPTKIFFLGYKSRRNWIFYRKENKNNQDLKRGPGNHENKRKTGQSKEILLFWGPNLQASGVLKIS